MQYEILDASELKMDEDKLIEELESFAKKHNLTLDIEDVELYYYGKISVTVRFMINRQRLKEK